MKTIKSNILRNIFVSIGLVIFGLIVSSFAITENTRQGAFLMSCPNFSNNYWDISGNIQSKADAWSKVPLETSSLPEAATPSKPILIVPSDQQTEYDDATFGWNIVTDSNGNDVTYDLYLGTSSSNLGLLQAGLYDGYENESLLTFVYEDNFYCLLIIPLSSTTTYYWKVVAKNSNGDAVESDVWSFTTSDTNYSVPTAPVSPTPSIDAADVNVVPMLQWALSEDADGDVVTYDLYLDTNNPPVTLLASGLSNPGFKIQNQLKGNSKYYWKVVAADGRGGQTPGAVWNFSTMNNPPASILLASPINNAINVLYNAELFWNKAFDADDDISYYELYYGIAEPLTNPLVTTSTNIFIHLSANTTYHWKVAAIDAHGARVTSDTWSFTTVASSLNHAPSSPQLLFPADNATDIGFQQSLEWSPSSDTDQDLVYYDVFFGTESDSVKPVATALTDTTYLPGGLRASTTYYWKVISYDRKGGMSESPLQSFSTTVDDVGISDISIYYRYYGSPLYQFTKSTLSPAFSVDSLSYKTTGRTTVLDAVAIALYYSNPTTIVSFNLPSSFTLTKDITSSSGLPSGRDIYLIEGTFSGHTFVTVHLRAGSTELVYTLDLGINRLPTAPVLKTPDDEARGIGTHPVFSWDGGEDPENGSVIYRVYLGTSSTQLNSVGNSLNKKTFTPTNTLLNSTRYYWKIVAMDMLSESTDSEVYSFVTEKPASLPITAPVLMYPRSISTYMETSFDLVWKYDLLRNATYDVYFGVDENPEKIAGGINDVRYTIKDISYNTTYYWKIVANHSDGTTTASAVQKFKTKPQDGNETGSFTDDRDGQVYQWVKIDNQYWMVHNLAYEPEENDGFTGYQYAADTGTGGKEYFILDNKTDNLNKYGYLYNWAGAMNATENTNPEFSKQGLCPSGWHIPVYEEWQAIYPTLTGTVGAAANTVYYENWNIPGRETEWLNQSGLSMLPSGYKTSVNTIVNTNAAQFWLADDFSDIRYLYDDSETRLKIYLRKESAYAGSSSVRCVKNTNNSPTVPILTSPADGTLNVDFSSVILNWTASTDPDGDSIKYQVYLDKDPAPSRIMAENITSDTYRANDLAEGTVWYWKVKATDSYGYTVESPVWSFTTSSGSGNSAPELPSIIQPLNEVTQVDLVPSLHWNSSSDPDGDAVVYDIYFGEGDSDLKRIAENVTTNTYLLTKVLSSLTTYTWQVVAKDGKGGNAESELSHFTTLNNPPQKPVLVTPANNMLGALTTQKLVWNETVDPDGDEVIYRIYSGTSPSALTLIASTSSGYFDYSFSQINITYYWQVIADDGKGGTTASDVWNFKTYTSLMANSTTLKSPLDGATGISVNPQLQWNTYPSSSFKYDLYVGTTVPVLVASDLTATSFTINALNGNSQLAPHTTYQWKIVLKSSQQNVNETATWSFTTLNQAPTKPVLSFPTDNAVNQPYTVALQWQKSTDADNDLVLYDVYLGTSPDLQQQISVSQQGTTFNIPSFILKPNTVYYWKVIAKDQYGGTITSDIRSFTTSNNAQNTAPSVPVLTAPSSYTNALQTPVTLQWQPSIDIDGDAVVYDVYLSSTNTFTAPLATGLTGTTYTITSGIQPHSVWYWKVSARDGNGGVASSITWNFTSQNNAPAAFQLAGPANESKLATTTAALAWTAATDPDGDAVVYDVYFDKNVQPVTRIAENLADISSFQTPVLQNNTAYYWRVVAKDLYNGKTNSSTYKLIGKNESPTAPVLQSPGNNSAVSTATTTLGWQQSADPDGDAIAYDVFFDTTPEPLHKLGTLHVGHSFATPALQENTHYYWKVTAKDGNGGAAESTTWSFTCQTDAVNQAPTVPVLLAPDNLSSSLQKDVTLAWYSSTDPEGDAVVYDLYTGNNATALTLQGKDLTTTTHTLDNLPSGQYHWKVVARDNSNNSSISAVWQFTVTINYTLAGLIMDALGKALENVLLDGFTIPVYTDAAGIYSTEVTEGWSGTVTPRLSGYTFNPVSSIYTNVQASGTEQNYTATYTGNYVITGYIKDNSGNAKADVLLQGFPAVVKTDETGQYTATVPSGWSGGITPVFEGITFDPPGRTYIRIEHDYTSEDYTVSIINGVAAINERAIVVYPNPAKNGIIRIQFPGDSAFIQIHDLIGNLIFAGQITNNSKIQLHSKGVLIVNIRTDSNSYTQKIVVLNTP
ncbi:MAG: FISUMP domain-containing protein [Breznakibacter sp.]